MNLTSAEIQAQIDSKNVAIEQEAANGQQTNHEAIIQWRAEIEVLKGQLITAEAEEATQAERTQAQTEKVDSIVLPLDFNALFENTAANDMIIEVVKEFQTQAYADHNAELAQVNADWTSKLQTQADNSSAQLTQLQARLDSELLQTQEDAKTISDLEQQYSQCLNDRKDAESKRDAAANELANANAEIYRLNQLITNQTPASKPVEIASSDRLTELAAKAKASAADNAARALARWNEAHVESIIPELKQIEEEPAAVSTPQEIPTAISSVDGHEATAEVVGTKEEAAVTPVTRAEIDAITFRLSAVEAHLNIPAAA